MGVLSDFFVADQGDVAAYDGGEDFPEGDYAQYKWVTPLELAGLLAALRGVPYEVELIHEFPLAHQASEDGPWTARIPDEMVRRLAECEPADLPKLAGAWASATEEELGWEPSAFEPILTDLARLARQAQASGKSLFLWNCL